MFDEETSYVVNMNRTAPRVTIQDPVSYLMECWIQPSIKEMAKEMFFEYVEENPKSKKDVKGAAFFSVYIAVRFLKMPICIQTIARACKIGHEKCSLDVREHPFTTWYEEVDGVVKKRGGRHVPICQARISEIMKKFHTHKIVLPSVPHTREFLRKTVQEEDVESYLDVIMEKAEALFAEDEYWEDRNKPQLFSYAILMSMAKIPECPFYQHAFRWPPGASENTIQQMVRELEGKFAFS